MKSRHSRGSGNLVWISAFAGMTFVLFLSLAQALEPGSFRADGPKTKKSVAFTFDDGPGEFTPQVLDILDRYKIKATFFMNGDQVELRPRIAQEVATRGHEIGEHTYSHINFYAYKKKNGLEKTKEKISDEMKKSREAIVKATGIAPRLCRMPHGFHKPWLGEIARSFDYALVNWTFGEDWLNLPEEKMAQDYIERLKPGSILLFHDGGRNRGKTVAILPKIIEEARKNYQIVTAGELLE